MQHMEQPDTPSDLSVVLALREGGLRQRAVGQQLQLSRARAANLERVAKALRRNPTWATWVAAGKLSRKHIEAVASLPADAADRLLREAIAGGWRAELLRKQVRVARGHRDEDQAHPDPNVAHLENRLSELLGTKVVLKTRPQGGGELILRYTDYETLDGLLERLGYREG